MHFFSFQDVFLFSDNVNEEIRMLRGLYIGASGMKAQEHRLNAISNNLANVDTTAYKKDTSVHKAFPEMLIRRTDDNGILKLPIGSIDTAPIVGKLGSGVEYNESYTIFTQGSLKETGNPFDISLDDEGFFSIQTNDGERYTRNGSFTLGKEGYLLTKEGYQVMWQNGPIEIKKHNFIIDEQGRIFKNNAISDDPRQLTSLEQNEWENTEYVDTLKVVDFKRPRFLQKQGSSLYLSNEITGEARVLEGSAMPVVRQGFLETSNVNSVNEMVNMIEVNRAYEANQKTITTQDNLLGKLITYTAQG